MPSNLKVWFISECSAANEIPLGRGISLVQQTCQIGNLILQLNFPKYKVIGSPTHYKSSVIVGAISRWIECVKLLCGGKSNWKTIYRARVIEEIVTRNPSRCNQHQLSPCSNHDYEMWLIRYFRYTSNRDSTTVGPLGPDSNPGSYSLFSWGGWRRRVSLMLVAGEIKWLKRFFSSFSPSWELQWELQWGN